MFVQKVDDVRFHWQVDDRHAALLRQSNLDEISKSYCKTDKTEFEQQFWSAFFLYSNAGLTKRPQEKILYLLPALEGLLLRDGNEPIQKNLGERLAFIIGKTVEQRIEIVETVTKFYAARSQFIHHGQEIKDLELFRKFMMIAWSLFFCLSLGARHFKTQKDFIDTLEMRKLSGVGLFQFSKAKESE